MENPSKILYSILEKIAKEMGGEVSFKIERPKDPIHGDFSSNIALVLSQNRGPVAPSSRPMSSVKDSLRALDGTPPGRATPLDLAQEIVGILNTKYKTLNTYFDKIEVVKPGFINFHLSNKYLQASVQNIILEGSDYGSVSQPKAFSSGGPPARRASVEFVSANPTGPLHIGNARGGPLGDTIANVLSKVGYKVIREYLHNDVGGQVDQLGEAIYFQLNPDQKSENYEVSYQGEYIKELAELVKEEIYEDEDLSQNEFIEKAGKVAVRIMLTEILEDCKQMGISFDKVTKESDLRKKAPRVLAKIKKSLKENEGALWFAPNDEFLKDRETVVRKSDGQYTYFASDIVYHDEKMSGNDIVIDILGANHSGHVPRLQAVIKALSFDVSNFKVVLYQWIRLKRGGEIVKMSKRAGTFVTAREVLDEVGKDAFRFFLLMQNSSTHMDFDLELAKKKASDNPVFYVQYAYTRIASIFTRIMNYELRIKNSDLSLLKSDEETSLVRKLVEFPYLVEEVSNNLSVNLLVNYAIDLASEFHKFYEKHQVISKDSDLSSARLSLLKATQITLKNTLDLLGVSAPEKM